MKKLKTIFGAILFIAMILTSCSGGTSNKEENSKESAIETTEQSNSAQISRKKEVLTKLIGEHKLKSISGFMGANTLVDYILENGKWSATSSEISGDMREGDKIDISQKDIQKLKSMKIVVTEDLTVSFSCEGKMYFSTTFNENGMNFFLQNSPKNYSPNMSEKLQSTSTFIDDYLYFYAKDKVSEAEIKFADFIEVMADAVVLKYNVKTNEFELVLFLSDCSDNSTFYFN